MKTKRKKNKFVAKVLDESSTTPSPNEWISFKIDSKDMCAKWKVTRSSSSPTEELLVFLRAVKTVGGVEKAKKLLEVMES